MRKPHADVIRLSPRCAENFVASVDVLIIMLCLLGARVLAPAGGAPVAAATADLAALLWKATGIGFMGVLIFALHRLGHYDRCRAAWQELGDFVAFGALLGALDVALALIAGSGWASLSSPGAQSSSCCRSPGRGCAGASTCSACGGARPSSSAPARTRAAPRRR